MEHIWYKGGHAHQEQKKGKSRRMRREHKGNKGVHTSHTFFLTHMNIDFMKLEGRLGASVT